MTPTSKTKILALIKTMQPGDSLYVDAAAKVATHYASLYGKKITTSVCLVIEDYGTMPTVKKLVKVTIL